MSLTFLNLQDIVLDLIEIDDTITRTRAKQFINMSARDVWTRYPWPERRAEGFSATIAPYTTGTVETTQDSTTVTGNGTTFTAAMAGRKFANTLDTAWYTFAFSTSTSLALDRAWVETSLAAGSSFTIYQDVVTLPDDCETLINLMTADPQRGAVMQPLARVDLDAMVYLPRSTGVPLQYAMLEHDASGYSRARIWPVPDDEYTVQYTYLTKWTDLTADNQVPPLEESRVDLVILGALRWAYTLAYEAGKAELMRSRFEAELARTWAHTNRNMPKTQVLRKFDDWSRWRNVINLPVVEA